MPLMLSSLVFESAHRLAIGMSSLQAFEFQMLVCHYPDFKIGFFEELSDINYRETSRGLSASQEKERSQTQTK
jgi:hypothetical protein